jgi:hypothetical protein
MWQSFILIGGCMRVIKSCGCCDSKAVFNHHGEGWCGSWAMFGIFNMFGYCKKTKEHSQELQDFHKRMKGVK